VADALVVKPHGLSFDELNDLRQYLERLLRLAVPSIKKYYEPTTGGFLHLLYREYLRNKGPAHFSNASTATCLAFLEESGRWNDGPWSEKRNDLRKAIIEKSEWRSAELPEHNPFTSPFLLDAIRRLGGYEGLSAKERTAVRKRVSELATAAASQGGVSVEGFPPTAFLTFKVVRVLDSWKALNDDIRAAVVAWVWPHLHQESVQISAEEADADVFELAYSILTISVVQSLDELQPQQRDTLRFTIDQFFSRQNPAGTWPRSRPLFVYPGLGNAYCYDYELLTYMLEDTRIRPYIFDKLPRLQDAAYALDNTKFPLDENAVGWASGHLRKITSAESWSTASVFHYCHLLHRLVSEAIRREVFQYVGDVYEVPAQESSRAFDGFLDCPVRPEGRPPRTLRRVIELNLLQPLADNRERAAQGHGIPKDVPVSAILYGPPGTSKTQLAKMVSRYLGWPLLSIDPSHLTRDGLDRLHAETHRLFGMLEACEEIVVLLDEFDELVRTREVGSEMESRFLTTAMLPKLAALSGRRRIVYLLATNHLENFDAAIARRGRFDLIIPVMPPLLTEKLDRWTDVKDHFSTLGVDIRQPQYRTLRAHLDALTYQEFEDTVPALLGTGDQAALIEVASSEYEKSTLGRPFPADEQEKSPSWVKRIERQRHYIRLRR
jgi:hypothetical protein